MVYPSGMIVFYTSDTIVCTSDMVIDSLYIWHDSSLYIRHDIYTSEMMFNTSKHVLTKCFFIYVQLLLPLFLLFVFLIL